MEDTAMLLQQARTLGESLAGDTRVRLYLDAQRAFQADSSARDSLREFELQRNHIRNLEAQRLPVEVADKHRLAELQARVSGHPTVKALLKAQADYVALLRQVNAAMEAPLAALRQPEPCS